MSQRILLINGSASGRQGNTAVVLEHIALHLRLQAEIDDLVLAEDCDESSWELRIRASQAFVFATGTYWDSWGWPLQRFLEQMTHLEVSEAWLGKPAAVLVTMHSVGGKAVLSRLQGVLSTLGLLLPPLTGWVYSATSQAVLDQTSVSAAACSPETAQFSPDLWCLEDLSVVAHNLLEALHGTRQWQSWPVDRNHFRERWLAEDSQPSPS